ncbi:hypothetical protein B0H19DRAFT_1247429 [Mycena capillaripes]|nr:hypothetical protein B0H19DRAFT_1247429 [Mycena capillaripes]
MPPKSPVYPAREAHSETPLALRELLAHPSKQKSPHPDSSSLLARIHPAQADIEHFILHIFTGSSPFRLVLNVSTPRFERARTPTWAGCLPRARIIGRNAWPHVAPRTARLRVVLTAVRRWPLHPQASLRAGPPGPEGYRPLPASPPHTLRTPLRGTKSQCPRRTPHVGRAKWVCTRKTHRDSAITCLLGRNHIEKHPPARASSSGCELGGWMPRSRRITRVHIHPARASPAVLVRIRLPETTHTAHMDLHLSIPRSIHAISDAPPISFSARAPRVHGKLGALAPRDLAATGSQKRRVVRSRGLASTHRVARRAHIPIVASIKRV